MFSEVDGVMSVTRTSSSSRHVQLLFYLVMAALVTTTFGQSRWQDVTQFHPYCIRLFRTCIETSSNNGTAGGSDYDVAVGICGNKMAICTFSGNLSWPWSTQIGGERPASAAVDATSRLIMYRNILSSPAVATSPQWQDLTNFLPDCRLEFRCCVDSSLLGGINHDVTVGICGHGMSICTQRQGSWPFGNDSSVYWQTPYTSARLQVYRNAYSISNGTVRNWENLTAFLAICRNLLTQCVAASGTTDIAIGNCGNRMAICTHESVLWPHTDDTTAAYTEPYDARWQRYANVVSSVTRWQDITRFSLFCIDKFFECFYTSSSIIEHLVVGVCGNKCLSARLTTIFGRMQIKCHQRMTRRGQD